MNELVEIDKDSQYDIITKGDINPTISSPNAELDLSFYQTRETLLDPERYRAFLRNAETRFRASKEYKDYKADLMNRGFTHCQIFGNIESDDMVDIELHHNVINLFDICILITEHMLNTVGYISTFDLIQLLILEHRSHRVGIVFLSKTAHQYYTNNLDSYIPPDMTFGKWWELISKYHFGITYDIAQKLTKYISKYQNALPNTINIMHQEQILDFARYNEFGVAPEQCKIISTNYRLADNAGEEW